MQIFAGGMPRASYGDRHTVSVVHGEKHVVFDFSSKVIDFFVICDADRRRRLSHSIGDVAGLETRRFYMLFYFICFLICFTWWWWFCMVG